MHLFLWSWIPQGTDFDGTLAFVASKTHMVGDFNPLKTTPLSRKIFLPERKDGESTHVAKHQICYSRRLETNIQSQRIMTHDTRRGHRSKMYMSMCCGLNMFKQPQQGSTKLFLGTSPKPVKRCRASPSKEMYSRSPRGEWENKPTKSWLWPLPCWKEDLWLKKLETP